MDITRLVLCKEEILEIQDKIGYRFTKLEYLFTAFTHASFANEHGIKSYERLEFLGDSMVNLTVAEVLYNKYTEADEGYLSKMRAKIVSTDSLAKAMDRLDIVRYLRTSGGAMSGEIRKNAHAKEDLFEAIAGAIMLDGGIEESKRFIIKMLHDFINSEAIKNNVTDFKSAALEQCAKRGKKALFESQSDGSGGFISSFIVDGKVVTIGKGTSKRKADAVAAELFFNSDKQ